MADNDQIRADLALKRYDCVLRYLAYENNVFWVRGQLFLAVNVGLVAFVANQIPTQPPFPIPALGPFPTWNRLSLVAALSIVGMILCLMWFKALIGAEHWIAHWIEILTGQTGNPNGDKGNFEEEAFGDIHVWREWVLHQPGKVHRPGPSLKKIAKGLACLFGVFWLLTLLYVVLLARAKYVGWIPAISN
jgi:hypothetical protein